MCCFTAKTEVHGTSIFARFVRPGVQALAYQMTYAAKQPTAMILPLPVALPAKEDAVRWKDLKDYPRLFEDLAMGFPAPEELNWGMARSKGVPEPAAPLAVHAVGDFVASFVPSLADFGRLDPRFVISNDVWAHIPVYSDYGFAVFQLENMEGTPHPMAFEFATRTPETLFYPTVHIHDGTVHDADAFDHVLYAQDGAFDARVGSYQGPERRDARTSFVRSRDAVERFARVEASAGLLDGKLLVHKTTLRGMLPNRDTTFDLRGVAARAGEGCGRCSASPEVASSPGVLPATALAGLAWVVRRREARRRDRG